ncbi:MAG: PLP-dependent aminotransferase family protein, partial [Oscillospiraceae bacterium]|nr:PLP-dependent aminotransferase family protein [Oscillospiraceae bacterium]
MDYKFSEKVAGLQASAIREILKFTSQPGVISFAAGNPAPEAFPTEKIADISTEILKNDPVLALQYSVSEGYPALRELLKKRMQLKGCFNPEID